MLSHARTHAHARARARLHPRLLSRSLALPACLSFFLFLVFSFSPSIVFSFGLGCCWTWAHRRLFGHGGTIAEGLIGPLLPCISPLHNDKAFKILHPGRLTTTHKSAQCSLFSFFFESDKNIIIHHAAIPPLRCCCSGSMCVTYRRELGERR